MNLSRIEAIYEESTNGELEDRADYRPSFLCNLGVNAAGPAASSSRSVGIFGKGAEARDPLE